MDCPGAIPTKGARLFATRDERGRMQLLPFTVPLKETPSEGDLEDLQVDSRFRFANKCITAGCRHFQEAEGTCGLARVVARMEGTAQAIERHASCPIKHSCRWHSEQGLQACAACDHVTRNIH